MKQQEITIIGGGNLGKSIIAGLVASDLFVPEAITVVGKTAKNLTEIKQRYGVQTTQDIVSAVQSPKWIILCVQPRQLDGVLVAIVAPDVRGFDSVDQIERTGAR